MALVATDERELLLPLAEGIHEDPLWDTFRRRLAARTRADEVRLLLRAGDAPSSAPLELRAGPRRFDLDGIVETGLLDYDALRPGRAYALEELLDADDKARRTAQLKALVRAGLRHARVVRAVSRGEHDAWIVLLREREDFRAADSAMLSSLAPHVAAALRTLAAIGGLKRHAQGSEAALARLGIGRLSFDAEARVIECDEIARRVLGAALGSPPVPGRRLQLLPEPARALGETCAALAGADAPTRRVVRVGERGALDLLLHPAAPADTLAPRAAAVGLVRDGTRENPASAARVIAALHGLSDNEAALAEALTRGESIVGAGAKLRLTPETARNYSKRIYAKTHTSGQADLVRLLLTGLAPLA